MLDLRQFAAWCHQRHVTFFAARRADIEGFARDLEARGRARSTVSRGLATIAGFYEYAVEEDLRVAHCLERAGQYSGPGCPPAGPPGSPPLSACQAWEAGGEQAAGYR